MSAQANKSGSIHEVKNIEREILLLEERLGDEDPDKIVNDHIKLLHDYNESKDAAQALMGKLAVIHGTTVRQMHEKFGLSKSD